jgi:hypothetical protein
MLPNRSSQFTPQNPPSVGHFEDAKRIEVRPRSAGARNTEAADESAAEGHATDTMLHFSCPACLHMLGTPKQSVTASVKCSECSAWVMPPQVVNVSLPGKTSLPPPRKTGGNQLKH